MNDAVNDCLRRIREHLEFIYPQHNCDQLAQEILELMGLSKSCATPKPHHNNWDQSDCFLITYGDSLVNGQQAPLRVLKSFLDDNLKGVVSGVHILPFFPFSSDDGFSVIDYLSVNESLGDWDDIKSLSKDYRLMADLVINHISSRSRWFENYKKRVHPGKDYFVETNPEEDVSMVVRPRNSPLLTEVDTLDGKAHVWCTFSADQVDLNFKNPDVLKEFVNIIRHYLEWGVEVFRMDAVAFLWKEYGSPCVHLQETHEIIKLLRTLIEHHTPQAMVITETNVPNRENLTYFGNANEAHAIYNFSLPPLLLYTLLKGDCFQLKTWLMSMPPAQAGTAYLNFIASHDGIGLRPLDGLIAEEDRALLVETVSGFGAKVTYRRSREGIDKPYELNVSLYSALAGTMETPKDGWQMQRYLCAHTIMLALEGIPAIYIHSLFGTENDLERVKHTGRHRSINRHSWQETMLKEALNDSGKHHGLVFDHMLKLIKLRCEQPAFHPNATQFTMHLGTQVFAFWRQSIDRRQSIFCLHNVTATQQLINLADINLIGTDAWFDLISDQSYDDLGGQLVLDPYQSVWISNRRGQE